MEVQKKGIGGQTATQTNICFDCKKACGGCSWSEFDPDARQPRFEPVPGWEAKPVMLQVGNHAGGKVLVETYQITDCPEFERDEPRKRDSRQLSETESKNFQKNILHILRRWADE